VVAGGGTASATRVLSGGTFVLSDGQASGTILNGSEEVVSGDVATGTSVGRGGEEIIQSGSTARGTTVGAGGEQIISGFGPYYDIGSAGFAVSTTVLGGGVEIVDGVASSTTVLNGGEMVVSSAGVTDAPPLAAAARWLSCPAASTAGTRSSTWATRSSRTPFPRPSAAAEQKSPWHRDQRHTRQRRDHGRVERRGGELHDG
jgi:autotransporter passenger strand-loop-strand repeat protein